MATDPTSTSRPGLPPYIVVFGPSGNCTLDLCPVQYSVYGYRPNLAANVIFTLLFSIAFFVHLWMGIKGKNWFFMAMMLVGTFSAVLGYIARCLMYNNPFNFVTFMIQLRMLFPVPYLPNRASSVLTLSATKSA